MYRQFLSTPSMSLKNDANNQELYNRLIAKRFELLPIPDKTLNSWLNYWIT